ncbi:hypothetical protein Tco_0465261 [Tanacetum coccineum]
MSDTVPPIPPPFGANTGNLSSPNRACNPTDNINNTTTNNVAQNVVDENLPQLLDSRGGSHVTNVPEFDKEDFSSWKDRFLVYVDGLEPYLLEILENRPFVPLSPSSTPTNPLPKPQNQWSHDDRRLVNQDKRLKNGTIAFNNSITLLESKIPLYRDMLKFLSNSCISKALTIQPFAFYIKYHREFWYANVVEDNTITFSLHNVDKPLSFNRDIFSSIIGLDYTKNFPNLPSKEMVKDALETLGLADEKDPELTFVDLDHS